MSQDMSHDLAQQNGHYTLQASTPEPEGTLELILAAHAEVARRDTSAERQRRLRTIWGSMGWGLFGVAGIYCLMLSSRITQQVPLIQPVAIDEAGHFQVIGVPQRLADYTPAESQYLDMLRDWIQDVRWRSDDPILSEAKWRAAEAHTCGDAVALLAQEKAHRQQETGPKPKVTLSIPQFSRAPVTGLQMWHGTWVETVTEFGKKPTDRARSGTFSMGRRMPKNAKEYDANRAGVCVRGFEWDK